MLKHLPRSGMDFFLHILNLSWSSYSFPSIWKTSSIIIIHQMGKPLDSPAFLRFISLISCVSKMFEPSFYPVYSSFWNVIPFFLPARPASALDGPLFFKFCTFPSPFRIGLTNPGRDLVRSCLLLIFLNYLTLSGIPLFSTNSFRLASLLVLLVGLNLFFLTGALVWFIKITKATSFESVEAFRNDPFLALCFSFSLLMIFRLLYLPPSAVLFSLTIWPFVPLPPWFPQRWRPHKELCFDWSAGLSTGGFLSIRANVRSPFSQ